MKPNMRNTGNRANGLFSQLAAEKKKTVMALCLIALMAFMWVRVLGKKTPDAAEAALKQAAVNRNTSRSDSQLKISFTELPEVKGRNDVLTRDFFASDGWQNFGGDREGTKKISVVSENGSEEVARRVAEKLKLQAIWFDQNPQAFVNDKLLAVGDKLLVGDGIGTYECEIVGIEENTVFIRCGQARIQLKLTQMIEGAD